DAVADASRALSEAVDADDAVLGSTPVLLEVTTPGVDRELTAPRHFRRSRGRLLALTVADGTRYRARLLAVDGEDLHLRQEPGRDDRGRPLKPPRGTPERPVIPIADVTAARVEVEFDPPPTSRSCSLTPRPPSRPDPHRRRAEMDIDMGALRALEREREISLPVLLDAIRSALHAAYLHTDHPVRDSEVLIDDSTGEVAV